MVRHTLIKAVVVAGLIVPSMPSLARSVVTVVIDEVGQNAEENDRNLTVGCKAFAPTVSQVRRYFLKAYPVESHVLTTERYSPCYATGTVEFSDHSSGRFQLYSGGTATLFWSRGGSVDLLYKQNRWHDPLACTYGLGDKPGC